MSAEPIDRWWDSPEYVAAEKAQERAAWRTVCWVNGGNLDEARKAAAEAMAAQEVLQRLTPPVA